MTPEERDRAIEFILNSLARYEARMEHEAEQRKLDAEQRKQEADQWKLEREQWKRNAELEAEQRKHEAKQRQKDRDKLIRWTEEVKGFASQVTELIAIHSRRLDDLNQWRRAHDEEHHGSDS